MNHSFFLVLNMEKIEQTFNDIKISVTEYSGFGEKKAFLILIWCQKYFFLEIYNRNLYFLITMSG